MLPLYRSSRPDGFCKKRVQRNFVKFTESHLCQSLYFNKIAGLSPTTLEDRSSTPEAFLGKGALKISSKLLTIFAKKCFIIDV